MRGLRSRLAAFALALAFGAAGAHSSGASAATGAVRSLLTTSASGATAGHLAVTGLPHASTGGGWERTETERTGTGAGEHGTRRIRVEPSSHLARASAAEPFELPVRRSRGLLGLTASPANAPPGS